MSEYFTNCCHCGKQNLMITDDGPETPCEFCGKPVGKKEGSNMNSVRKTLQEINSEHAKQDSSQDSGLQPVPPRPAAPPGATLRQTMMLSHDYFEANKPAIVSEWEKLGRPRALKRWGISQSTLNGLLMRWGLKPKPEKKRSAPVGESKKASSPESPESPSTTRVTKVDKGDLRLPPFPAFKDCGSELVQLRWLDKYVELARK